MKLYVIDTNVILLAGTMVKDVPYDQLKCYQKCIIFLNELMKQNDSVLVDAEGRVITEYKSHFRLIPYPNMADLFLDMQCPTQCFIIWKSYHQMSMNTIRRVRN